MNAIIRLDGYTPITSKLLGSDCKTKFYTWSSGGWRFCRVQSVNVEADVERTVVVGVDRMNRPFGDLWKSRHTFGCNAIHSRVVQGYKKGYVATHIAKKVSRHAAVQLPIDHISESCVMGRN